MVQLTIQDKYSRQYKAGFPHLFKDALVDVSPLTKEGMILDLVNRQGQFIARGYYGKQNKGYGWVLTQNKEEAIDQTFFIKKISAALAKRKSLFDDPSTTAFRVFNGEGDGIGGLTIDYYADYYLITWYSEGIYQFQSLVINALEQSTSVKGIYEKKRFKQGGKYIDDDDFVSGERAQFPLIIQENGANFAVDLNDGPMTGIFLDQRDVRRTIQNHYSNDKTVLNTFSYTGVFSVYATLGGARKTTSVDLANRSKEKTIEQFAVNGLDPTQHEIRVMDVFNYFDYAIKHELAYDLVILDPPSFARSKKRTFSVQKDYVGLLKSAIQVTEDDGVIVASTNFSGFGMDKFKTMIHQAFKESNARYQIVETFRLPEDFQYHKQFKEGNYLKVVFIKKIRS
ncbi:SAM-dependent methyltransferase [Pelagirhabdus alkalitolerans]|uniref:SAM-dependent methyltransferase n=1 Tax=Pelagirhabdus alkalitolerans TaxID=1612202 RepID=A0A1G6IXS6_9BACI|nr:class I SAM-dependent rRNA methyltransferase [Pelagirhabdus alkalitolerans]SDC11211.1 SAM-dependent methyltransferase [Pelagirhabdus alkalitolerans]